MDQAGLRQTRRRACWKVVLAAGLLASLGPARVAADVPMILHYQGNVEMSGTNYHGTGYFKFALVDASGTTTHWSNDGSSAGGGEPTGAVPVPVDNGYYSVLLGNTNIPGMTVSIPYVLFRQNERVWLRIWFSHSTVNFEQLAPDQRIAAVGYAMVAQTVVEGGITALAIADGAVTTEKLAENAITSAVIPDDLDLGSTYTVGSLQIWPESPGGASISPQILLKGASGKIATRGDVVSESAFKAVIGNPCSDLATPKSVAALRAEAYGGLVVTHDEDEVTTALFGSQSDAGGVVKLYKKSGEPGAVLTGDEGGSEGGGQLTLYQHTTDRLGITLDADAGGENGGGRVAVYGGSGVGAVLSGDEGGSNNGAQLTLYQRWNNGDITGIEMDADAGGANGGGKVRVCQSSGINGIVLTGDDGGADSGAELKLYQHGGQEGIKLDADAGGDNGGGRLSLCKANGTESIILRAKDDDGYGRVITQVLEITGGSDLAEQFNVSQGTGTVEPGMIVCIDAKRPGELRVSDRPYDATVAGVVSGAGGVKPGMLMGQQGSIANGQHPVALTGRVYCRCDATRGPIAPGDLLTTSDVPGHAMKVTDPSRAQGAILGKAMTPLDRGQGFVLVLVTLQ